VLSVKEVKALEKEIQTAYDYYVRKSLNAHVETLNNDIKTNKEFADRVYKHIIEKLSSGIYYLRRDYNDRYYIESGSTTVYFSNVDSEMVHRRDTDACEEIVKPLREERDSLLDVIYSRPSAEELSSVYNYILGSKTTIECAK
jgi:hypothetical protein